MGADEQTVTMLGMGEMGQALASSVLDRGRRVVVWNRTPGRAESLRRRGATEIRDLENDLTGKGPVVVCLYDHASVVAVLGPLLPRLRGRTVLNLTTTTPDEARRAAAESLAAGVDYLDGVLMATPPMIGTPDAQVLASGPADTFAAHRDLLGTWGTASYEGEDAGLAALVDLALLSGMYAMLTGFVHGTAMVQAGGRTASEFAARASTFLGAMATSLPASALVLDGAEPDQQVQSQDWTLTVLDTIARASTELGVDPVPVDTVRRLVRRRIEAGEGQAPFESIRDALTA